MDKENHCKDCKFWQPRFVGVGSCRLEGTPPARMWVSDPDKLLFTLSSFGCNQFAQKDDIALVEKETL